MKKRVKTWHKAVIATAVIASAAVVSLSLTPAHIAPDYLYPAPVTTGMVATQDLTLLRATNPTYSQAHRMTTATQKNQVCNQYPANCKVPHEIDHFCPLSIGCADSVSNLWAQPETNMWNGVNYGFHQKDALELKLYYAVQQGTMTPKEAQDTILNDWVAAYIKYIGNPTGQNYGNIYVSDPDDN